MYPQFLGIGAQRAGTTWLHANLSKHPAIWLPRIKEIHYFDRKYPLSTPSWTQPVRDNREMLLRRMQRFDIEKILTRIKSPRLSELLWDYKYYRGKLTNEWYASLFAEAGARISGDITPAYSILESSAVNQVNEVATRCKNNLPDERPDRKSLVTRKKGFHPLQKDESGSGAAGQLSGPFQKPRFAHARRLFENHQYLEPLLR